MEETIELITFVDVKELTEMKIGIEAQRIFRHNKHGMDYVVLEEIKELQKIDRQNEYFIFVKPGPDKCLGGKDNFHIVEISCPTYPLWEQWALPRAARKCGVDMLHCTSNTAPVACQTPLLLTLHDIIFLEPRDKSNKSLYQNLGWLYRRMVVPKVLGHCRKIITVSQYELDNIVTKLNIPRSRMEMIYNGYNKWFQPLEDKEKIYARYASERGFFFFLGNTDPKKNTERTIIAYSKYLHKSNIKRKLLVADLSRDVIDNILRRNKIENVANNIIAAGYIANKDLPYVYNAAFAFLYTSLRESFGIPLLEAMACGTPVITGNKSALPEIAGEAALLANPESTDDIAELMLSLETNEAIGKSLREKGIHRAASFSWESTAKKILSVYNSVAEENTKE